MPVTRVSGSRIPERTVSTRATSEVRLLAEACTAARMPSSMSREESTAARTACAFCSSSWNEARASALMKGLRLVARRISTMWRLAVSFFRVRMLRPATAIPAASSSAPA